MSQTDGGGNRRRRPSFSFAASGATVDDVVDKHIAICTEVVMAFLAPIPPERTEALPRRTRHCQWRFLEGDGTSVTPLAGIGGVVQRYPALRQLG